MGITLPIALFFGILQGASELFPVSSLGHAVVVPALFGIGVRESNADFLPFLVLLHIGTATALICLYWRQWGRIVAGFVRSAVTGKVRGGDDRLAWLLVVGTIPAGLIGFIFQKPLQANFGNPRLAAGLLIVNGGMLLGAEKQFRSIEEMGFGRAAVIGACQIVALFPGMSRSGSTMAGGLIAGLRHEEAVRFSFLLATPIILAAGLLEVPSLGGTANLGPMLVGGVAAGLTAYASARFLVRYFRVGRLDPYAYYCAGLGVLGLILLR